MDAKEKKNVRLRRHARIRKKVSGSSERPRLVVFKSNKFIYVQLVDDIAGHTLAAASSQDKAIQEGVANRKSVAAASKVGVLIAKRAKEKKIECVVFDRGGYKFHGKVKALAESALASGLKF